MIGVLVSGEGTNLQALLDAELPVVAVASNKQGAQALARADRAGVPSEAFPLDVFPDRAARDTAMAEWLEGHGVELVVCAGYMHLLDRSFLDRFPERVVNVHPAPLPDFPGAHPLEDLLAAGAPAAAATVHYLDEGVDSGAVIASEPVPILPNDTVESLRERVHEAEHRLLPEVVRALCAR
ncbi:MAG: phosphoribosylglycinamide formyltransferase [Actinobacteria bacterium]|nr:phosphoribosylglycinamide formyltransferase [Actinomycetota bacterium]